MSKDFNIDKFLHALQTAKYGVYPEALADILAHLVAEGQDAARDKIRKQYDLATDWIPRGINAVPVTPSQRKAAARAIASYGDAFGFVYARTKGDPSKSLAFMEDHETGATRTPHKGKAIAVPGKHWSKEDARNARGRTKPEWKPEALLKRFREAGSEYRNGTTWTPKVTGRRKGQHRQNQWFLIEGKGSTPMIALRRSKARRGLIFAYGLAKDSKIAATLDYYTEVYTRAMRRLPAIVAGVSTAKLNKVIR